MSNKYTRDCPDCGGELMGTAGMTFDTMPAAYPVTCMKCDWEGYAELKSEREAYEEAQKNPKKGPGSWPEWPKPKNQ